MEAYKQLMAAVVQASATGDPDFPLLAKYATGEALVTVRSSINVYRQNALTAKGPMRMSPQVTSTSPDGASAKIKDCLDDSQWLLYKADGSVHGNAPGGRHNTDADAVRVEGAWKVSVLRIGEPGTC
ncbi:hypothetical protein LO772_27265 [Yinghuangia sp. ASG 101]|uniref:hypothetical protein n=1 Tax=Yinghuangia sp. ASG 101 TaxID=2896848 RepID=UPI001E578D7D|nr:hypothetical protein [Yinghuangia sp. ASG 101]UGQ10515.1 hypothetical protein LO772_27265 [Yinghuangia sp. ASG 101]